MRWAAARKALYAALLLVGCHSPSGPPPAPSAAPAPPAPTSAEARWVPLRAAEAVTLAELPATVLPTAGTQALVNPPYAGQVVRLHVRPGDQVEAGQVLVEIMMPTVVTAAGERAAARTKIEGYQRRLTQLRALEAEGLVRSVDLSEADMRLSEARADEQRASAILRSAGIGDPEPRGLGLDRGAVPLRSPIAGTVTEVAAALGETRDTAGAPLVRIAGTASARIEARAPERLMEGARFELVTGNGDSIPVRLVAVSPVIDPRDGSAAAWFETEPARSLRAGLTGKVRVVPPAGGGLTVAPRSAVGRGPAGTFVRARRPDGPAPVAVKVVLSSGADVVIDSPLRAGAEIAERIPESGS